jgi:hypothetical protein
MYGVTWEPSQVAVDMAATMTRFSNEVTVSRYRCLIAT